MPHIEEKLTFSDDSPHSYPSIMPDCDLAYQPQLNPCLAGSPTIFFKQPAEVSITIKTEFKINTSVRLTSKTGVSRC